MDSEILLRFDSDGSDSHSDDEDSGGEPNRSGGLTVASDDSGGDTDSDGEDHGDEPNMSGSLVVHRDEQIYISLFFGMGIYLRK